MSVQVVGGLLVILNDQRHHKNEPFMKEPLWSMLGFHLKQLGNLRLTDLKMYFTSLKSENRLFSQTAVN